MNRSDGYNSRRLYYLFHVAQFVAKNRSVVLGNCELLALPFNGNRPRFSPTDRMPRCARSVMAR